MMRIEKTQSILRKAKLTLTALAVMMTSLSGTVFVVWTFANLVPRANTIYHRYLDEFGDEVCAMRLKRVIPFIY